MASTAAPSQLITLSTLKFMKPAELAALLRQSQLQSQPQSQQSQYQQTQPESPRSSSSSSSSIAIIDVRDNDHIGGHIKSSQWVPINQLDARMPELLRVNGDKDRIVFHCMLSQQRGPKSALAYARARVAKLRKEAKGDEADTASEGGPKEIVDRDGRVGAQQICVLEGGFDAWRAEYAEDETLTEGYVEDLW